MQIERDGQFSGSDFDGLQGMEELEFGLDGDERAMTEADTLMDASDDGDHEVGEVVKPVKVYTGRVSQTVSLQKTLDATQLYLNEIGFSSLLTPEEEVYYARLAMKGEESGRKRMIESN